MEKNAVSDKSLTAIITELAKLRIRIDSLPNRPLRDVYEDEYQERRARLKNAAPLKWKDAVDELIEEEIRKIEDSRTADRE